MKIQKINLAIQVQKTTNKTFQNKLSFGKVTKYNDEFISESKHSILEESVMPISTGIYGQNIYDPLEQLNCFDPLSVFYIGKETDKYNENNFCIQDNI